MRWLYHGRQWDLSPIDIRKVAADPIGWNYVLLPGALPYQVLGSGLVNHDWVQGVSVVKLSGLHFFSKKPGMVQIGESTRH